MDEVQVSAAIDSGLVLTKASRAGGPVTCVSLPKRDCAVWALGPYLERSLAGSNQQLLAFPQGGTIHGIHYVQNDQIWDSVVFGGRSLAFCNVLAPSGMNRQDVLHDEQKRPQLTISDWIWDVECVYQKETRKNSLVIGMARHMVEIWEISSTSLPLEATCQRRIYGMPSCLVTSMHLLRHDEDLWIAAGTSFQEIRIWSLNQSLDEVSSMSYSLKGHAGIVHSVKFSSDGQSLASTSDDRSVRKWTYDPSLQEWSQQWVGWGHSARVWSVAFGPESVVSSAEDGTTRVWSLTTGEALACIQHSCSLWTIDTLDEIAIVGTTDGTVALYDLSSRIEGRRLAVTESVLVPDDRPKQPTTSTPDLDNQSTKEAVIEIPINDQPRKAKKKKKSSKKASSQVIVGLKWLERSDCSSILLLATRAGSLMSLHVQTKEWKQLEPWWDTTLQDSHQILATDGCCMAMNEDWAAIGTTRGDVVLVSVFTTTVRRRIVLSARDLRSVQGFTWINPTTLVSFHVSAVAWWAFPSKDLERMEKPTFVLNMDTKGVPMSCAYDEKSQYAAIGDSRGNLALFHLESSGGDNSSISLEANSILERIHQKEHITAIAFEDNRILSVGNDGCLHTAYISGDYLCKGWSIPASSMTGINRIWTQSAPRDKSRTYVAGYYGNTFLMADMFTGHELFSVATGGRQRIHDFLFHSPATESLSADQFRMAVCMNKKDGTNSLLLHCVDGVSKKVEAPSPLSFHDGVSLHGETIFSACFFSIGMKGRSLFLLTGSEDCTSKVSLYRSDKLIDSISLTPQESCVRAVCSSQLDDSSALLVIGGGKLALQFFLARSKNDSGQTIESLQDLEINFLGKGATRAKAKIDHRINAVKAIPIQASDRSHLVVAGDSDGNCHLFMVSEDTQLRPPPGQLVQASSRPILCIDLLSINGRVLVVLGTTGGDVLLFDLPGSFVELSDQWDDLRASWLPLSSYQAHQMGTNSVSSSIQSKEDYDGVVVVICTGGDDQAVCICEAHIATSRPSKLELNYKLCPRVTREASFSAIKGVAQFLSKGKRFILTVGYSQQLAVWSCGEIEGSNLQLEHHVPVDLGDVNCLAVDDRLCSECLLAVGGLGMETFALRKA
jgi:WD40 repeat protein